MWMDEWMAQWVCLAERQKAGAEQLDRCVDCQKFECRDERAGQPSRERDISAAPFVIAETCQSAPHSFPACCRRPAVCVAARSGASDLIRP